MLVPTRSLSSDGDRLLLCDGQDYVVWDVLRWKRIRRIEPMPHGATFSADGTKLVASDGRSTARIWNASTGTVLRELVGHQGLQASSFSFWVEATSPFLSPLSPRNAAAS
jgi:WD40 repeat protein